jgi:hypothetical protein
VTARGQAVSPATIRGIESGGKKPGARLLRLLGLVLESVPPGAAEPQPVEGDALIAALTRQTEAIDRLVRTLESVASQAILAGVQDALREAGIDPAAGASPPVPLPGQR